MWRAAAPGRRRASARRRAPARDRRPGLALLGERDRSPPPTSPGLACSSTIRWMAGTPRPSWTRSTSRCRCKVSIRVGSSSARHAGERSTTMAVLVAHVGSTRGGRSPRDEQAALAIVLPTEPMRPLRVGGGGTAVLLGDGALSARRRGTWRMPPAMVSGVLLGVCSTGPKDHQSGEQRTCHPRGASFRQPSLGSSPGDSRPARRFGREFEWGALIDGIIARNSRRGVVSGPVHNGCIDRRRVSWIVGRRRKTPKRDAVST